MRSTSQLRQVWHPPCSRRPPLTYTMWTGVRLNVDGRIGEALRALDQIMRAWNYRPKEGESWGYNCRRITGGTGYSLHAYGIAIDINSRANPYGPRLITDMPPGMVAAIKAVRTKGGHRVWGWGGDYSRNKDAMHFEIVASPAELARGIEWGTVGGQAPVVGPLGSRLLRQGDQGSDVAEWQRLLRIPGDGDFGPQTHSATVAFQQRHGLDADGIVGPATLRAARGGQVQTQTVTPAPPPTPHTSIEEDDMVIVSAFGGWYWFAGGLLSHIADGAEPDEVKQARAAGIKVIPMSAQAFKNRLLAGTEARSDLAAKVDAELQK